MESDVWDDGGEFNEILQKHIRAAVECFLNNGFWSLDARELVLKRYAAEPLECCVSATIAELIDDELRGYVPGNIVDSVDILTHDFNADPDPYLDEVRVNLDKLQRCLRILRA